ncbi:MAG: tryptophan synthase subunit alpha [Sphaerochaetaceae bacterium]|nr:tryptophan synthase subunit alpha [Sphaerochaetaceae bacterium]
MINISSNKNKLISKKHTPFLIGYLLAGYKDNEDCLNTIKNIPNNTIDVLELGFPSNNPYSDGKVISDAHSIVDKEIASSVSYWKKIRDVCDYPIWLMAYKDDFITTGIYKEFAKMNLIDAIVIPDSDNDERIQLQNELKDFNIDVIGFVNPSMSEKQLDQVLTNFTFIYEQLYVGVTGSNHSQTNFESMLNYTLNKYPNTIPFAGFGLNNKEKLEIVYNKGFKGAVIGTELLKRYNTSKEELYNFLIEVSRSKTR